ncbi:hypothetical protein [Saccharopolyspora cebuensis]|uniref:DUF3558 domain-containing protein n=1 Tax=Saccharopolyspora cebuensis TaxID=418759 RepID=A0ABV4CHL2_9PSEU
MAAVSGLGKQVAKPRGLRFGALWVGLLVATASCSQPESGYREDPGACSVVSERSIVEQLGQEAVQFPNTAETNDTDTTRSSKCEWESFHSPNWGNPAQAKITVTIRVSVTEDGDPNVRAAEGSYQMSGRPGEIADSPPMVIGDVSRHSFEPGRDQGPGSQVATVDFRRANAHVTVEYRGWGDRDFSNHFLPREQHEAATRDIAQQVHAELGEPK